MGDYVTKYIIIGPDNELRGLYDYLKKHFGEVVDGRSSSDYFLENFLKNINMLPETVTGHISRFIILGGEEWCFESFIEFKPLSSFTDLGIKVPIGNCIFFEMIDYFEPANIVFQTVIEKIAPNCTLYYMSNNEYEGEAYSNDVKREIFTDSDYLISSDIDPEDPEYAEYEIGENKNAREIYKYIVKNIDDIDKYFSTEEIRKIIYDIDGLIGTNSFKSSDYIYNFNRNFMDKDYPFEFYIYPIEKEEKPTKSFKEFAADAWQVKL